MISNLAITMLDLKFRSLKIIHVRIPALQLMEMLKKIQMVVRCAIDSIEETDWNNSQQKSGRKKKLDVKPYLVNCVKGLKNLKKLQVILLI